MLSVLAEKNELGELRDYIAKMVRTVPPSTRYRLASNPELDALLQYYAYEAERAGVRFTSRIETPVDHFAKSVDLTVVLGNLLGLGRQALCRAGDGQPAGERGSGRRVLRRRTICGFADRQGSGRLHDSGAEQL